MAIVFNQLLTGSGVRAAMAIKSVIASGVPSCCMRLVIILKAVFSRSSILVTTYGCRREIFYITVINKKDRKNIPGLYVIVKSSASLTHYFITTFHFVRRSLFGPAFMFCAVHLYNLWREFSNNVNQCLLRLHHHFYVLVSKR